MRGNSTEKEIDFTEKRVTVMGLGIAGGAVEDALFFIEHGAHVTVTDMKDASELSRSLARLEGKEVELHLGGHREEDFANADLIIRNPGVPEDSPYLQIAREHDVPIEMGSGIFARYADMSRLVGITGTKGKSTTTALVHRILLRKDPRAYHGGDVDGSPIRFIDEANSGVWGAMELSSWRLEGMAPHRKSPHIALITSIAQDHLNRYESYDAYRASKKLIFAFQEAGDIAILNYESDYLRQVATEVPSRLIWFSGTGKPEPAHGEVGCYIENGVIYAGGGEYDYSKLNPKALHHPGNVAAALSVALVLEIPINEALEAIVSFEGLFGRLQNVGRLGETVFYNDTAATNPYATTQSIEAVGRERLALIVGGEDKQMDFDELAAALKGIPSIFVLPGSASEKLLEEAGKLGVENLQRVGTLREAVRAAYAATPRAVLFSPGGASFNMFKNEFDRGEQFIKEVEALKDGTQHEG